MTTMIDRNSEGRDTGEGIVSAVEDRAQVSLEEQSLHEQRAIRIGLEMLLAYYTGDRPDLLQAAQAES